MEYEKFFRPKAVSVYPFLMLFFVLYKWDYCVTSYRLQNIHKNSHNKHGNF